jgi:hypothetical protein
LSHWNICCRARLIFWRHGVELKVRANGTDCDLQDCTRHASTTGASGEHVADNLGAMAAFFFPSSFFSFPSPAFLLFRLLPFPFLPFLSDQW